MSEPARPVRGLREADRFELKRRYPQAFRAPIAKRCLSLAIVVGGAILAVYTLWRFGFSPAKFVDGLDKLGIVVVLMMPPDPGSQFWHYASALAETLAIAFLGTLGAAIIALPMSMLAARNVVANSILHFASRRFLDTIRGVDTLIWALIWINVVGLGPFAGILAIMDFGLRLVRQAFLGGDRGVGSQAGRRRGVRRRVGTARLPLWYSTTGSARTAEPGPLLF